uniref:Neuropilin n=1 Tax=Sinocyclocheilus grahami TaxID=75366 RepID=A0A672PZG2_SINGR
MDLFTKLCGSLLVLCAALVYGEEEPCGGHLDASDAGYITTPGYPLEYPPHQNCRWVITAPEPSQRIVLNFNPHFELEKLDCRYDFIEIRDGNSENADLLGRHCSNIAPPAIISSGPILLIKFVSDYAHQGAGFSLRYEIYKTGSDCSRNFTSPSGVIESPGFPDKYPHNLECTFIIIVPPHMDVTLTFLTFDLENDPLQGSEGECKYDWLEVWDGLPQVGPLIGRHCGTKIPSEIQSSTGILSLSFHTDMAVAKDGFSACYNMTLKEVNDNFHCSNALGMESNKISDDQISASSSFYDGRWSPRQARLNFEDNSWTPNEDSNKEYIQVDLHFLKVLTGIATQGAVSKETHKSYFVATFKLEVSTNGEDWMIYRYGKNHKVFHANVDPSEVVLNRIPQPVLARFVRIRPQTWKNGIALRFELYGCQITDAPCSEMQGMLSGLLPDSQISASSMRDIHGATGASRLVASRSGWFPSPTQPVAGEEWLQVDLGVPKTVRGIITQGARGVDGSTSAENRAFVRKYKLSHSLNGKDWSYIIDSKTNLPKIFEGNTHYDTPEIRRFDEIVAQFIRVYPERWSPAGIGMRLEILGCDLPESTTIPDTATPTLPPHEETSTAHRTPGNQTGLCDHQCTVFAVFVGHFVLTHCTGVTGSWNNNVLQFEYSKIAFLYTHFDIEYFIWVVFVFQTERRPEDLGNNRLFNGRERIGQGFPFPAWTTPNPSREPPVTRISEKDNAWLYTLDPILVTIIVMSSLGVLLGAVCAGLLLYCTCSYNGLSSRSTTTLENYNFELYDDIKHKVKINQQRCCSEA